jgi:hypothetical protein
LAGTDVMPNILARLELFGLDKSKFLEFNYLPASCNYLVVGVKKSSSSSDISCVVGQINGD